MYMKVFVLLFLIQPLLLLAQSKSSISFSVSKINPGTIHDVSCSGIRDNKPEFKVTIQSCSVETQKCHGTSSSIISSNLLLEKLSPNVFELDYDSLVKTSFKIKVEEYDKYLSNDVIIEKNITGKDIISNVLSETTANQVLTLETNSSDGFELKLVISVNNPIIKSYKELKIKIDNNQNIHSLLPLISKHGVKLKEAGIHKIKLSDQFGLVDSETLTLNNLQIEKNNVNDAFFNKIYRLKKLEEKGLNISSENIPISIAALDKFETYFQAIIDKGISQIVLSKWRNSNQITVPNLKEYYLIVEENGALDENDFEELLSLKTPHERLENFLKIHTSGERFLRDENISITLSNNYESEKTNYLDLKVKGLPNGYQLKQEIFYLGLDDSLSQVSFGGFAVALKNDNTMRINHNGLREDVDVIFFVPKACHATEGCFDIAPPNTSEVIFVSKKGSQNPLLAKYLKDSQVKLKTFEQRQKPKWVGHNKTCNTNEPLIMSVAYAEAGYFITSAAYTANTKYLTLEELLLSGYSPDCTSLEWQENSAALSLLARAEADKTKELQLLLKYGADINRKNASGDTALHHTLYPGVLNYTHAKFLLSSGANFYAKNNQGKTPLDVFCESYDPEYERAVKILKMIKEYYPRAMCVE